MICCKIITDYNSSTGDFDKLVQSLMKKGDFLWDNNALFFGDIEGDTTEKQVGNLLKKAGFNKFYIETYSQTNQPRESDFINGWLMDRIVRINYKMCEDESQKVFHDISIGLDLLNEEIDRLTLEAQQKSQDKEEEELDG